MQNPKSNPQTLTRWILENQKNVKIKGIFNLYGTTGEINESEDKVQKLDELSNEIMKNSLTYTGQTAIMVSEEEKEAVQVEKSIRGNYAVVFDPLDGSSNIDANISIGTIFGIFRVDSKTEPTEKDGKDLVAAGYCMYGASTLMVISLGGMNVQGFTLDNTMGEFILTHPNIQIPVKSKRIYSVNEGNSSKWDAAVTSFVKECHNPTDEKGQWSHRYVGSMVSDVHRTLMYGGIFMYPADKKNPTGKLRLLYEGNPMAFLIVNAGGKATTGKEPILEIVPDNIHQRIPVILGTNWMVDNVVELYKNSGL